MSNLDMQALASCGHIRVIVGMIENKMETSIDYIVYLGLFRDWKYSLWSRSFLEKK